MKNLLTDISGVRVGHAHDTAVASGVTAASYSPAVASIDVRGGGPGTREDGLLKPESTSRRSTPSRYPAARRSGWTPRRRTGLACRTGPGLRIREAVISIVPGAICFDLLKGGNKAWGRFPPYRDLAYAARVRRATICAGQRRRRPRRDDRQFQGRAGLASAQTGGGVTVGALAVVNAVGSVTVGDGPWLWAAPFEMGNVRRTRTAAFVHARHAQRTAQGRPGCGVSENTTLVVVVTDAVLSKAQAKRLAMIAHTGMARAIYPSMPRRMATWCMPLRPARSRSTAGRPHRTRDGGRHTVARAIARGVTVRPRYPFWVRYRRGAIASARSQSEGIIAGSRAQALTETDAVAPDEIAWA